MKRINLALTAKAEDTFLSLVVKLVPRRVLPDMLTGLALLSAIIGGVLYFFADQYRFLLLIINACLFVHWLGDSLDGRLARVRNQIRLRYGYYVDHILDTISAALFLGGLSASTLTDTTAWVWVLSLMFLSMIHVFLKTKVNNIFELSVQ